MSITLTDNSQDSKPIPVCVPARFLKLPYKDLSVEQQKVVDHPDYLMHVKEGNPTGWFVQQDSELLVRLGDVQKKPLYLALATYVQRINTLEKFGAIASRRQRHMLDRLYVHLNWLTKEHLPSGSGFDSGTQLLTSADSFKGGLTSLVFSTSFHHMDQHGGYDGWTDHMVVVKPDWEGFNIKCTGPNRNAVRDYVEETFHHALMVEVEIEA